MYEIPRDYIEVSYTVHLLIDHACYCTYMYMVLLAHAIQHNFEKTIILYWPRPIQHIGL